MAKQQRDDDFDMTRKLALEAFGEHIITSRGDRRWTMHRLDAEGKRLGSYATEIVQVTRGICVGGDIYPVIFQGDLQLIGECHDIQYYVAQKATLGMGSDALTWRKSGRSKQLDARVIYAHAAVERLWSLLQAEATNG